MRHRRLRFPARLHGLLRGLRDAREANGPERNVLLVRLLHLLGILLQELTDERAFCVGEKPTGLGVLTVLPRPSLELFSGQEWLILGLCFGTLLRCLYRLAHSRFHPGGVSVLL